MADDRKHQRLLIWDFPDGSVLRVHMEGPADVSMALDFLEEWIAIKRRECARRTQPARETSHGG